jgi:hypothetical protein
MYKSRISVPRHGWKSRVGVWVWKIIFEINRKAKAMPSPSHQAEALQSMKIHGSAYLSAAGSEAAGKLKLRRYRHAACRPGGCV